MKKPRRTEIDLARLRRNTELACRDGCGVCGEAPHTAHHRFTQQSGHAAGWSFAEIDAVDNLMGVCKGCHERIHAGINYDWAIEHDYLRTNV